MFFENDCYKKIKKPAPYTHTHTYISWQSLISYEPLPWAWFIYSLLSAIKFRRKNSEKLEEKKTDSSGEFLLTQNWVAYLWYCILGWKSLTGWDKILAWAQHQRFMWVSRGQHDLRQWNRVIWGWMDKGVQRSNTEAKVFFSLSIFLVLTWRG